MRALDSKEINGRTLKVGDNRRDHRRERSLSRERRRDEEMSEIRGRRYSLTDEKTISAVLKGCVRLHLAVDSVTRSTQCRLCNEIFKERHSFNDHPCALSLKDRISETIETFFEARLERD